jgi:hypothetical protein
MKFCTIRNGLDMSRGYIVGKSLRAAIKGDPKCGWGDGGREWPSMRSENERRGGEKSKALCEARSSEV